MNPTTEDTRRRLAGLPKSERCSPKCPGWFVGDSDDQRGQYVMACDECNSNREPGTQVDDADVAAIPAARRALAKALSPRGDRRARAHALELHAMRLALCDVLAIIGGGENTKEIDRAYSRGQEALA